MPVIAGSVQLTYLELSARSYEIASTYKSWSESDYPRRYCHERSNMLIAILAVSEGGRRICALDSLITPKLASRQWWKIRVCR